MRPAKALISIIFLLLLPGAARAVTLQEVAGDWCLEVMDVPVFRPLVFKGYMTIDPPEGGSAQTVGELYVETLDDGSFGLQSLVLREGEGGTIDAQGTIIRQQNWIEDTLSMRLDSEDRLVGVGYDPNGTSFSYVFRRGACVRATS